MQLKTQTVLNLTRQNLEEILREYFKKKYDKEIVEMDYLVEENAKLNNNDSEEDFEENDMTLSCIVLKLEEQVLIENIPDIPEQDRTVIEKGDSTIKSKKGK